jgi:general secretion pathway protein G
VRLHGKKSRTFGSVGNGFTIVELLVTLVIVSILASVAFPMAELAVQRTKEQQLRQSLMQIREALDAYKLAVDDGRILAKVGDSGFPKTLDVLVDGVPNAKDPTGMKLYFLRRVPRDPFYPDQKADPAATWGKRSYASSATAPKEGVDVYDVYSMAAGEALNGTPYRDW